MLLCDFGLLGLVRVCLVGYLVLMWCMVWLFGFVVTSLYCLVIAVLRFWCLACGWWVWCLGLIVLLISLFYSTWCLVFVLIISADFGYCL